jgi:hypothetical protein
VTLNVNGTAYQLQTSSSGYATLYLNLPPGDTSANTYQVQATFKGTNPRSTSLNASDPYGDQYPVCTTNQYDLLPSTNSSTLFVLLQYTDSITAAKTMEQMQQEAESEGLQVWGPDSWCLWPPFFKLHARIAINWLNMDVHSWIGLFACGIDSCAGMGRLLQQGFSNASQDEFGLIESAFISSMTATTTLFVTSLVAATFTCWTPGFWLVLVGYTLGGLAALGMADSLLDVSTSKAILFGFGFTLISLLIGAYTANTLLKSIPFMVQAELTGADPASLAAKSIVNSLVNYALGATSIACQLVFRNPLMVPFAVATLALAALAIYLAWTR